MARRKRKEETPEWTPPEFDEVAYMRTEMEGARAAVVVIIWALAGAIISYALFALNLPLVAFFAGLFFATLLYWILPMVKVHVKDFKRKDWAGHGITYFFSWLAFWILAINAPFSDFTDPTAGEFTAGVYNSAVTPPEPGTVICAGPASGRITIPQGPTNDTVYVLFRATDNVGVTSVSVTVDSMPVTGAVEQVSGLSACRSSGQYLPGTYAISIPIVSDFSFTISVTATDGVGRIARGGVLVLVT